MPPTLPHFGTLAPPTNPDHAVGLACLGVLLIFVELNRPGRILPGAGGLLLLLFSTAALFRDAIRPSAVVLLLCCCAAFLLNWWRPVPFALLLLSTILAIVSLRLLLPPGIHGQIQTPVAIVCGGTLGSLSALLTCIARRARRSKALD